MLVEAQAERALPLALLEDEREAVARLRDDNAIDDAVMRQVQQALDADEIRLLGVEAST